MSIKIPFSLFGLPIFFLSAAASHSANQTLESNSVQEQEELRTLLDKVIELDLSEREDAETLTVCISFGDSELLARGFGTLGRGRSLHAAEAHSAVPAGSLLPAFLSVAVLQLAEKGALSLDEDITIHCSELGEPKGILVRHLLSHSSGWTSEESSTLGAAREASSGGDPNDPHAHLLQWLAQLPLENQPGACTLIDEANIAMLGILVERVSGKTVREYLTNAIFEPAEMSTTTWEPASRSTDCRTDVAGGRFRFGSAAEVFGAARLVSSAQDLDHFVRACRDRELLGDDGFERWSTADLLSDGTEASVTLGATPRRLGKASGVSFGGRCSGFSVHVAYYPVYDLSVVLFGSGEGLQILERRLSRAVLDLPTPGVHDLPLSDAEREPYLGAYYSGCNQILLTERDAHLVALFNDGTHHVLLHQGRHRFLAEGDLDVQFEFQLNRDISPPRAESFILREHGAARTCVRLE